MLETKKAAKAAVSALRRELKNLEVAPEALTHSAAQQILARARVQELERLGSDACR